MPPQQHQCVDAEENHLKFFLPKVPEFRWWIAAHATCASQLAAALLQLLPTSCLFILHLPLSQFAATSIDTVICNRESHSVQLTNLPSAHSHANAAVSQLILSGRNHSLLCPARSSCTYTSLFFSGRCLYFLSCRCSEEKGRDGRCCSLAGLLFKVYYLFTTYVKQVSPGPFGIWPMAHRRLNEMGLGGWRSGHTPCSWIPPCSYCGLWAWTLAHAQCSFLWWAGCLSCHSASHWSFPPYGVNQSFPTMTIFAKIHFLSSASPRNHVNKGMQPDLLDWSEETCHPKKMTISRSISFFFNIRGKVWPPF